MKKVPSLKFALTFGILFYNFPYGAAHTFYEGTIHLFALCVEVPKLLAFTHTSFFAIIEKNRRESKRRN